MAVDKATVLLLDPSFGGVTDPLWALAFRFQQSVITEGHWGDVYEQAAVLYVAHWLTLAGYSGSASGAGSVAGGLLQSESVGQVSRTYSVPAQSAAHGSQGLGSTKWGRMLLALMEQFGMHFFVT
jgi:hypothetical protein